MPLIVERAFRPIMIVVLISAATLAISAPRLVRADSASGLPGLDGNGIALCGSSYCPGFSEQLSTSRANDVVVLIANCSVCKISDSAGLAYTFRATVGSGDGVLSEYYALANTPLSSDNVTVSLSYMHVFAVHGYSAKIFDLATPLLVNCPTDAPCSGSVAPSGTDFIFTGVSDSPRGQCAGVSGWNGLFVNGHFASGYQIQSAPRTSSVSYLCLQYPDTGGANYAAIGLMMDAIALQPQKYTLSWQGFDWDGGREETVTMNGQLLASLPATDSPQNSATYMPFFLNITSSVVQGTNTLTFTHANWDCSVSDSVKNLQLTVGGIGVYSNATALPLTCARSLTYRFGVGPPPPPIWPLVVGEAQSPIVPAANHPVTLTAVGGGGVPPYTFSWDFGDGSTQSGNVVSHSYASDGSYRVTLTGRDSVQPSSNTQTLSWFLIVSTLPLPLSADFTHTPIFPLVGQTVTFTGAATGGVAPYSFSWNFGDGSTASGSVVTHSYSSSSSYNVSLTVTDSASPFPHRKTVTQFPIILSLLTATLTYSPPSPHVNEAVTFSGFGYGGIPPYIYSWTFGDGATGSGISVTHVYTSARTYAVLLTVQDSASPSPETHNVTRSIVVSAGQPNTYVLSWQGYDWDGGNEETILINGNLAGSLPATDSPQNGGVYVPFSLNITSFVVKGTNSLTFYHANWDCSVSDNVRNLQVTAGTTVLYSNATVYPLGCGQQLVYNFTI